MAKKPAQPSSSVGPLCPKCLDNGSDNPEHKGLGLGRWIGPTYISPKALTMVDRSNPTRVIPNTVTVEEHLIFRCPNCGYVRTESCRDAKQEGGV